VEYSSPFDFCSGVGVGDSGGDADGDGDGDGGKDASSCAIFTGDGKERVGCARKGGVVFA
jgi:hypothetical protein